MAASLTADTQGLTLATSGTPATQVLLVQHALPWHLILKNVSGGNVTAVRLRARTHAAGPWTPWESVSTGLPIAAGDTLSLVERDLRAQAIEVEVTAASAGSVEFWLAGV